MKTTYTPQRKAFLPLVFFLLLLLLLPVGASDWTDDYNVVWDTQSANSGGSMPVSGGDIGLNVWVENDELLFYIGRVNCRDENGALLKPGRVRVKISPNPFAEGFRQELKLREGHAEITAPGENGGVIKLWVEVARPVIHLEAAMNQPVSITSTYENWRREDRILRNESNKMGARSMCMITFDAYPGKVVVRKDTVETDADADAVRFHHRIPGNSFLFDYSVSQQKLGPVVDQLWNPLRHLTWGGMMRGEGFSLDGTTSGIYGTTAFEGWRIRSDAPARNHHVEILMHTDQAATVDDWKSGLQSLADSPVTRAEAWDDNQAWWAQFWDRSHIVVNPSAVESDPAWRIGRNYNLFRYMLASNVHGSEPSVFNGGVFTFDPVYVDGRKYTPDYRQWGASFHAQNQRLLYWPMLKTGDFEMMLPLFSQLRNGLASATARVRHYWGHDGAGFVEAPGPLMLPGPAIYGFREGGRRRRPARLEAGVQFNSGVAYNYQNQLEYGWMMLEYHRFTGLDITPYLPMIKQSVIFYDEHYQYRRNALKGSPLTDDGKLEIAPSNALEGFRGCTNPAEAVAGLKRVVAELSALPESMNTTAERKRWEEIAARLPELPVATGNGLPYMKPAADRSHGHFLSPEMYPLFPYDLFSLGQPDLNIMQNTWDRIPDSEKKNTFRAWISWAQMPIHAARLGDRTHAKSLILQKLGDGNRRFSAFFPIGHDWQPDHNWGGSGMIALQEMLMQTIGDEIRLLPAWPADWDVDFKLHAPRQTTVEGRFKDGKLTSLTVTPESRRADVVLMLPEAPATDVVKVDIQAGSNTQSGWSAWTLSKTFNSSAQTSSFAYDDTTGGTLDVTLTPEKRAGARIYGISKISDPAKLTIPNVWADQYFDNATSANPITLKLDNLKAGTYQYTSYHYADHFTLATQKGTTRVFVNGVDSGEDVTFFAATDGAMVTAADLDQYGTFTTTFTVDNDNDAVTIRYGNRTNGNSFGLNGFELSTATGGNRFDD